MWMSEIVYVSHVVHKQQASDSLSQDQKEQLV